MGKTELSFKTNGRPNVNQDIERLLKALNGVEKVDISGRSITVKHNYNSKDGSEFVNALKGRFKASVVKLTKE
ncbi:hypothetical protein SUGI_0242290 [Cryptomeria japonica]|nr:hypothetical protein SUGI_0242290 [Cryptomeria japonica]